MWKDVRISQCIYLNWGSHGWDLRREHQPYFNFSAYRVKHLLQLIAETLYSGILKYGCENLNPKRTSAVRLPAGIINAIKNAPLSSTTSLKIATLPVLTASIHPTHSSDLTILTISRSLRCRASSPIPPIRVHS